MQPFFLVPLVPTINSSAAAETDFPASNVLLDEPGLTYRGSAESDTYVVLDFGAATSIDTVAALGTNLRSTDTWRVRAATTAGGTTSAPGYDSTALAAWSGTKTADTSKQVLAISSAQSYRYWRIDFFATGHADGYVEVSRLALGVRVEAPHDMAPRASRVLIDQSVVDSGAGWETVDERDAWPGWRVNFAWLTETFWNETWWPFLQTAKASKRVLFVPFPDDADKLQDTAVFGRMRSFDNEHPVYDGWQNEILIVSNGL